MDSHLKSPFFILVAAMFFSAFVFATPVFVTFDGKYQQKNYIVTNIFLLQKDAPNYEPGYQEVKLDPSVTAKEGLIGTSSLLFGKEGRKSQYLLGQINGKKGKILMRIETHETDDPDSQANAIWVQSTTEDIYNIRFPAYFSQSEDNFPVIRLPDQPIASGPCNTKLCFPSVGWVFTYDLPVQITANVKPIVFDSNAIDAVGKSVGAEVRLKPRTAEGQFKVQSAGPVQGNQLKDSNADAFYQSMRFESRFYFPGKVGDILWRGLKDKNQWVDNGQYAIEMKALPHSLSGTTLKPVSGQLSLSLTKPFRVAAYATQVGQYLLKKGELLKIQDYSFKATETSLSGLSNIMVEEGGGKTRKTRIVEVGKFIKTGEGRQLNPGVIYPETEEARNDYAVRFMLSPFSVKALPAGLQKMYQGTEDQYVVLTVVQTKELEGRIAPKIIEPDASPKPPASTATKKTGSTKEAPYLASPRIGQIEPLSGKVRIHFSVSVSSDVSLILYRTNGNNRMQIGSTVSGSMADEGQAYTQEEKRFENGQDGGFLQQFYDFPLYGGTDGTYRVDFSARPKMRASAGQQYPTEKTQMPFTLKNGQLANRLQGAQCRAFAQVPVWQMLPAASQLSQPWYSRTVQYYPGQCMESSACNDQQGKSETQSNIYGKQCLQTEVCCVLLKVTTTPSGEVDRTLTARANQVQETTTDTAVLTEYNARRTRCRTILKASVCNEDAQCEWNGGTENTCTPNWQAANVMTNDPDFKRLDASIQVDQAGKLRQFCTDKKGQTRDACTSPRPGFSYFVDKGRNTQTQTELPNACLFTAGTGKCNAKLVRVPSAGK